MCTFRMAGQEVNAPGHNLLINHVESPPVQSVNQNSPVGTPRRSHEAVSAPRDSANIRNLVDGLDPEIMAKIMTEITKKLKEVEPEKPGSEVKFFDRVAKRNPKVYEGKEDPMILEEWIRQMEKIFDVVEVPDNKRINIRTFYLFGTADIWWRTVRNTFQGPGATWASFTEALQAKFYPLHMQKQKQKEFLTLNKRIYQ